MGVDSIVVLTIVVGATTLDAVKQWKAEIDSKVTFKGGVPIPAVLLVNKVDLLTNIEDAFSIGSSYERVASECGFSSYFVTSAKTNTKIKEAMESLISEIINRGQTSSHFQGEEVDAVGVQLSSTYDDHEEESSCC